MDVIIRPVAGPDDRNIIASDHGVDVGAAFSIDEEYLSVVSGEWILAMEPHLDVLLGLKHVAPPDGLDVSPMERAHSMAAATMAVFAVEAQAARLAAIDRLPMPKRKRTGHRRPGSAELIAHATMSHRNDYGWAASVLEMFVMRDVLAHNHIWQIRLTRGPDWDVQPTLTDATWRYGRVTTRRYRGLAVTSGTNRTRRLGLHLVPTELRRWDVARLLTIAVEALDRLVACDVENMPSVADHHLRGGRSLRTIVAALAQD